MKLVIFDFDGTLVDSRKLITESNRVVFGQFGFALPSEEDSFSLVGMSLELIPNLMIIDRRMPIRDERWT